MDRSTVRQQLRPHLQKLQAAREALDDCVTALRVETRTETRDPVPPRAPRPAHPEPTR